MKFKIYSAKELNEYYCTITPSGQMSFSIVFHRRYNNPCQAGVIIGTNADDITDKSLYIRLTNVIDDNTFLFKGTKYKVIFVGPLLKVLSLKPNETTRYVLQKVEGLEEEVFKLIRHSSRHHKVITIK